MGYNYVTRNGQRVEAAVARAFDRMNAAFHAAFGLWLLITSGTRTSAEQEAIFRERYVTAGNVNGRYVYDTRIWNGVRWYRVSSAGTVAVPSTSNHEENGPNGPRSIDIADTGGDPGVTSRGSRRDQWMVDHAGEFEFENEGNNFGERWHKTFRGQLGGTADSGGDSGGIAFNQTVQDQQNWLRARRGETIDADGRKGPATTAAFKRYQEFLKSNWGYTGEIDGDWGAGTQAAHSRYYDSLNPANQPTFPPFPLPAGYYFGPEGGPMQSISGWNSYNAELRVWQQRMKDRGWIITVDGLYGPKGATQPEGETAGVALAFQKEKGLTADGLIGPDTWNAAWTAPITPEGGGSTPDPTPTPTPTPEPAPDGSYVPVAGGPDNPRSLPVVKAVYPGAKFALQAPLGDGVRGFKGDPPQAVPVLIDLAVLHRTGSDRDELDWFSYKNSRSSCPNWYIRKDGTVIELIPPSRKPTLNGPEWNYRIVGWELQGAGDGTPEQLAAVIKLWAWLTGFDGKQLEGIPVTLKPNRGSLKAHREIQATECPGQWWMDRMDTIITEARKLNEGSTPTPEPEPEPTPTPTIPAGYRLVKTADIEAALEASRAVTARLEALLND